MRGLRPERVATALALGAAVALLPQPARAAPEHSHALVFGTPAAGHAPDCLCRAPNAVARVGQSACIGGRLAECVMVLNNTSWKFSDAPCPVSVLTAPVPAR